MPDSIKLRFKSSIPIRLENALTSFGFTRYARKQGVWVIYEKMPGQVVVKPDDAAEDIVDPDEFGVTADVQDQLRARMYKLIDRYLDPYSNIPAIKIQCMAIANQLPDNQRDWVINWISKELDSDFHTPPWEDEDYQPNLEGFC